MRTRTGLLGALYNCRGGEGPDLFQSGFGRKKEEKKKDSMKKGGTRKRGEDRMGGMPHKRREAIQKKTSSSHFCKARRRGWPGIKKWKRLGARRWYGGVVKWGRGKKGLSLLQGQFQGRINISHLRRGTQGETGTDRKRSSREGKNQDHLEGETQQNKGR